MNEIRFAGAKLTKESKHYCVYSLWDKFNGDSKKRSAELVSKHKTEASAIKAVDEIVSTHSPQTIHARQYMHTHKNILNAILNT